MSACEEYLDRIMRSIDGETTPQEEAELQAHLSSCEPCRTLYQCYQAVDQGILTTEEEPPKQLHSAIMRSIHQDQETYHPKSWLRRGRFTMIAAAAAVVLILVGRFGPQFSLQTGHYTTSSAAEAAMDEAYTGNAAMPEVAAEFRSGDTAVAAGPKEEAPAAGDEAEAQQLPETAGTTGTEEFSGGAAKDPVMDSGEDTALQQELEAAGCSGTAYLLADTDDETLQALLSETEYIAAVLESGKTAYGVSLDTLQPLLDNGSLTVEKAFSLDETSDLVWVLPS